MKILFIALFFFAFSTGSFAQSQDTIHWSPCYKLKWEDFKGKADSSSKYGAISFCTIKYSVSHNSNSYFYKVSCFFNKKISWVRIHSDIGLIHEQGHFNIAELYARKLRKAFKEYKFNSTTIMEDFKLLFNNNNKERAKYDALYDMETDFSRNQKAQSYWNKKVSSELESLKEFAL